MIQDLSGFSTRLMKDLNRGSVILKLELALFAADANRPMKVKALPYWDQSLDSEDPVGRSGFPRGPWARTISPMRVLKLSIHVICFHHESFAVPTPLLA